MSVKRRTVRPANQTSNHQERCSAARKSENMSEGGKDQLKLSVMSDVYIIR